MKIKILYFAWLRERIGKSSEVIETEAKTVEQLIKDLRSKEERYDFAFSDLSSVRVALDQTLSTFDSSLKNVNEVAFFPPMTGG
ncbi:molybdopterin converting factor subunit 1 [Amylibacter sp.]|jgi:molybdopterin synthase sulfur carrier subunit|nr:molybdopterin converting factor subunit 1 [Amylibacter sp.]MDA8853922.1 molybdopterin converting factor subunit 1 [Amylibacter sp.]MDA8913760.1 molybdopterin converting factor subunit 1 [Amylibacter sp.]MDA9074307.1 molybdopterin converting factor subunit 1 [Amylibacter sp.]MDA9178853.1 molybdopterin converting factor subunit 1 [Amylibacter sp.]|tara:strand:- start:6326 stop:6577 length:252 start_codon:yes stop_codon:yes gene_type:complete